ncbi:unnamed protein product [Acanthoscelides obtectus]|uniref:Uncharacterized protein n=1 Tax=Acanthoscelides obtectus TaxID=200917 RepID=A0A9P0M8U1_ACAOB|nr:unnamed protein product [Acanthoscelides obtectus]CAK1661213.1 hypothetical protein AOBTE_LOCUS22517 [Acanthoscelides obtectus]
MHDRNTSDLGMEDLRQRILAATDEMKRTLSTKVTVTQLRRKLRACIRNNGRQFEQDL